VICSLKNSELKWQSWFIEFKVTRCHLGEGWILAGNPGAAGAGGCAPRSVATRLGRCPARTGRRGGASHPGSESCVAGADSGLRPNARCFCFRRGLPEWDSGTWRRPPRKGRPYRRAEFESNDCGITGGTRRGGPAGGVVVEAMR